MKITSIETIRVADRPNVVWVEVHTDEGITGLGESWFGAAAIETDIHDRIAPLLIGESAVGKTPEQEKARVQIERRAADRPWSRPPAANDKSPDSATRVAAAGFDYVDDESWEEF